MEGSDATAGSLLGKRPGEELEDEQAAKRAMLMPDQVAAFTSDGVAAADSSAAAPEAAAACGSGSSLTALEQDALFGGLGREQFMERHIHRRLHSVAATLPDNALLELGQQTFTQQFLSLEAAGLATGPMGGVAGAVPMGHFTGAGVVQQGGGAAENGFQGLSREEFIQRRIHRKLHMQVGHMSDGELKQLGAMSFNDQFQSLGHGPQQDFGGGCSAGMSGGGGLRPGGLAAALQGTNLLARDLPAGAAAVTEADPSGMFGGLGRNAFLQQYVHRRLHNVASGLSDEQLLELGQLGFNKQFQVFEQQQVVPMDGFAGMGREQYIAERIHRKLHQMVAALSDAEILELGRRSFNDQFAILVEGGGAPQPMPQQMQQPAVSGYNPQAQVYQFVPVGNGTVAPVSAATTQSSSALQAQDAGGFGGFGGGGGGDSWGAGGGGKSFGGKSSSWGKGGDSWSKGGGGDSWGKGGGKWGSSGGGGGWKGGGGGGWKGGHEGVAQDIFGGMSRDEFLQVFIHRRLHSTVAKYEDDQLLELAAMSYNQQFTYVEQQGASILGDMGRDAYMQKHVHRTLHQQAAMLSDEQLLSLGQLGFKKQFDHLQYLLQSGGGGEMPLSAAAADYGGDAKHH
mmetsp:Transcript_43667/g.103048  ORF Transcript_43667/g.103048 Transcript_43667/m.103048 type:complete len:624 (+) Transcript_43667:119-1990(+)